MSKLYIIAGWYNKNRYCKKIKKIVKDYFIMYLTKIIELDYKKNEQKNRAFVEVAKYLCQQGMKVQDISYDKIVEKIDGLRQA